MKKELYVKLKELREENNLSQVKLAEYLGVSRQAISQWETGKAYPDVENIARLCTLYRISMDKLMEVDVHGEAQEELCEAGECAVTNKAEEGKTVLDARQVKTLEKLGLAVILVIATQFAFFGILTVITVAIWMRWTKRDYVMIYMLGIICLLISINNTYIMIDHWFFDFGIARIIPV